MRVLYLALMHERRQRESTYATSIMPSVSFDVFLFHAFGNIFHTRGRVIRKAVPEFRIMLYGNVKYRHSVKWTLILDIEFYQWNESIASHVMSLIINLFLILIAKYIQYVRHCVKILIAVFCFSCSLVHFFQQNIISAWRYYESVSWNHRYLEAG